MGKGLYSDNLVLSECEIRINDSYGEDLCSRNLLEIGQLYCLLNYIHKCINQPKKSTKTNLVNLERLTQLEGCTIKLPVIYSELSSIVLEEYLEGVGNELIEGNQLAYSSYLLASAVNLQLEVDTYYDAEYEIELSLETLDVYYDKNHQYGNQYLNCKSGNIIYLLPLRGNDYYKKMTLPSYKDKKLILNPACVIVILEDGIFISMETFSSKDNIIKYTLPTTEFESNVLLSFDEFEELFENWKNYFSKELKAAGIKGEK